MARMNSAKSHVHAFFTHGAAARFRCNNAGDGGSAVQQDERTPLMRKSLAVLGSVLSVVIITMVAMTLPVFAGGGNHVETQNTSASGLSTSSNGQIVFRRYFDADQTKGALYVVNPDGSEVRQITYPPNGWRDNVPAWSPDGKTVVFERFKADESTSRVMVVNPDSGKTRPVVPCTGETCVYAIDPYFSPDGKSIAYARTVAPPDAQDPSDWKLFYSAIFIVGLDGSDPRQVTSTPERHKGQPPTFETTDPTFSPNGETLAFLRTHFRPEENTAVFVQPIGSPEDAQRITPWKMNCQDRPTFSPDGKRLLFRCMPQGEGTCPPISTGSAPTAPACTSSPSHLPIGNASTRLLTELPQWTGLDNSGTHRRVRCGWQRRRVRHSYPRRQGGAHGEPDQEREVGQRSRLGRPPTCWLEEGRPDSSREAWSRDASVLDAQPACAEAAVRLSGSDVGVPGG